MILGEFRKYRRINLRAWVFRGSLVFALLQFYCASLWARPTTTHQAKRVVAGWLRTEMQPLGTALGQKIIKVETFSNANGEPIYYVVYLQPSGFVIVSADDLIEPIIAFADDGFFDPSLNNPLGALVSQDLNGRVAAVREAQETKSMAMQGAVPSAQPKWNQLEGLANVPREKLLLMGLGGISDVRVAPLVQSRWGQEYVCGNYCYNYYTYSPYTYIRYPCGCVATAMAQLMRFHQYPTSGIGIHYFTVTYYGVSSTEPTLGGDGFGGAYNWGQMVLNPNCSTTEAQREAIGALCYDAAISVNTNFELGGSSAYGDKVRESLRAIFWYNNVIGGWNNGYNIGVGLNGMINPGLDARYPILLAIYGPSGPAHAVVCDGYGYNSSTLYHHLNMGWSGTDEAWYNLPQINAGGYSYNCIYGSLYNIYTSGSGEIISGRVTDSTGNAISGATVAAHRTGGATYSALTNSKGIYALSKIPSASTYTVSVTKTGYDFTNQTVTNGTSIDMENTSGNRWGIDFQGTAVTVVGDFCGANSDQPDGYVDYWDLLYFARRWHTSLGDNNWDSRCDLDKEDNYVDYWDLLVFAQQWHKGQKP